MGRGRKAETPCISCNSAFASMPGCLGWCVFAAVRGVLRCLERAFRVAKAIRNQRYNLRRGDLHELRDVNVW